MNQSKPLTPYGKRASILATLKMIVVLVLSGANAIKYGALWLIFKKRRVESLGLYMFAAASRTLLHMMRADDIQMIVGLRTLAAELQTPFYRSLTKKALGFNTALDTTAGKYGAELAPGLNAPSCVWLYEVEDRKASDPVIYFIHGGGFALGMTFTQVYWVVDLVKALPQHRISVLALDYSLTPYARYPTQLNEAFYGFEALAKTCDRIITLGDSAGGNLSASLAMSLKQYPDLHAKLFGQVYVSPWTELLPEQSGSVINNAHSDWVCEMFAARCAGWYAGAEVNEELGVFKVPVKDPRCDIGAATAQDLQQVLPKNTACVWSTNELLADAVERFCQKGKITETFAEKGTIHDILYFGHNNDSSRFVIGVLNKWLSVPYKPVESKPVKDAVKEAPKPQAAAAKPAQPTPPPTTQAPKPAAKQTPQVKEVSKEPTVEVSKPAEPAAAPKAAVDVTSGKKGKKSKQTGTPKLATAEVEAITPTTPTKQ